MKYDLFISYSREDNKNGRVTELIERIEAEYLEFAKEELNCFFDKKDIKGMDDWRHRLLQGLKDSHLLLIILSPNYLSSPYCEWEVVEYLKYEYSRATQGDGVAQIYFLEIPGLDKPGFREKASSWLNKVNSRQRFDFRPWYNEGTNSLKKNHVRERLEELKLALRKRINRMRIISNSPGNLITPNARFVGRESEMKLLHEFVGLGKLRAITAIHGLGGLGKTAIAFQYAYAYADFFPGGRWKINCANESSLAVALKKLDSDLKINFTKDEKKDDVRGAKRILQELEKLASKKIKSKSKNKNQNIPSVLLILDNVDDVNLIQTPDSDLFAGKDWLKVLATTRFGHEEIGIDELKINMLSIDELSFEEAHSLIESYQPNGSFNNQSERNKAGEIVKLLGGFTLAVEVVALYLYERKGRITCEAFLELLKKEGIFKVSDIVGKKTKAKTSIDHTKLVSATLAPTLDILSVEEKLILKYASLLPSDSIPVSWLREMVIKKYKKFSLNAEPGLDDPWLSLLNHLVSLRLLQVTEVDDDEINIQVVRMHRLLQELVVSKMKNKEAKNKYANLIDLILNRSDVINKTWFKPEYRWEIAPMISFNKELLLKKDKNGPKLLNWNSRWLLWSVCDKSIDLMYESARSQLELNNEKASQVMAGIQSGLGRIQSFRGNYYDAEKSLKQAYSIDKKIWDSNHPIVAVRLNDLGTLYKNIQEYSKAEQYLKKSFSVLKKTLGHNHPETATIASNLASLYQDLDNFLKAEPLYKIALKIRLNHFGNFNPIVASTKHNLATLFLRTKRIKEAETYFRAALEIDTKTIGEGNPKVQNRLNNLGIALLMQGKLIEARETITKAWELKNGKV